MNDNKIITNVVANMVIQNIGKAIKGKSLMDIRTPLEKMFSKRNISFSFSPMPHFSIKDKGKTIVIVNKKYADDAELIVDELAIGYLGKI